MNPHASAKIRAPRGRSILMAVAALLVATLAACGSQTERAQHAAPDEAPPLDSLSGKELVIASWGGAWTKMSRDIIGKKFEKETGVRIKYVDVASGFATKVLEQKNSGGVQWDILDSVGTDMFRLEEAGELLHFSPKMMDELEQMVRPEALPDDYYVSTGSAGYVLACRPDLAKRCPETARDFWDTDEFPGPRSIPDAPEQALAFALQADGVPGNKLYPLDLDRGFKKLDEIESSITLWPGSGDEQAKALRSGEVVMAVTWNSRAYELKESGVPITISWTNGIANPNGMPILANGPNTGVAMAFLQWWAGNLEVQKEWAEASTYAGPSKGLLEALPKEVADKLPESHSATVQDSKWYVSHIDEIQDQWNRYRR